MSDIFIGSRIEKLDIGEASPNISRVNIVVDSENMYTAGNDDGRTVELECPWGSQEMANSVLGKVNDYVYKPYSGEKAILDPAFEIGDSITVGGLYSALLYADTVYNSACLSSISAPEGDETDEEYPSAATKNSSIKRKIAQTRSLITKTAEQIRLEVENELEGLSSAIEIDLTEISARVSDAEDSIEVTINTLDGLTVKDSAGTVKIKGGMVTADGLHVNAANVDGTLTANQINLTGSITWPDLAADAQNEINGAYSAAASAQNTASAAYNNSTAMSSTVNDIVNGNYTGGAFLNGHTIYGPEIVGGSIYWGTGGTWGSLTRTYGSDGINTTNIVELYSNAGIVLAATTGFRIEADSLWINLDISDVHFRRNGAYVSLATLLGG